MFPLILVCIIGFLKLGCIFIVHLGRLQIEILINIFSCWLKIIENVFIKCSFLFSTLGGLFEIVDSIVKVWLFV
ncbi:Uncharacterised protein [Mycobacteroides abscessus subsp. abscessus]|nr:Uncharacterised protein [Mycobacteroides abscessus subsp. abscessus]